MIVLSDVKFNGNFEFSGTLLNGSVPWARLTNVPTISSLALGTTSSTAFRGDYGNTAYTHSQAAHAPSNANNYTHPANHPPSIITQDVSNRFVTDAEKSTWNAKGTSNLALGTTSVTAHRGDYGNTAYTHSQAAHAPSTAQANQTVTAGNGMDFNATSGNVTVAMGTPTGLSNSTTNALTSIGHTHSITGFALSSETPTRKKFDTNQSPWSYVVGSFNTHAVYMVIASGIQTSAGTRTAMVHTGGGHYGITYLSSSGPTTMSLSIISGHLVSVTVTTSGANFNVAVIQMG